MKEWIMGVQPEIFEFIEKGIKTIEGRTPDINVLEKDYRKLKKEDILVFLKEDETKKTAKYKIKYLVHYSNVKNMLISEGLNNILPNIKTIEEGVKLYNSFPNYSQRIKELGIYAIGIGDKIENKSNS